MLESQCGSGGGSSTPGLTGLKPLTAGQNITAGQICRQNTESVAVLASATSKETGCGMLYRAQTDLQSGQEGIFKYYGETDGPDLEAGKTLYLSTIPGTLTTEPPTQQGNIIRAFSESVGNARMIITMNQIYMTV